MIQNGFGLDINELDTDPIHRYKIYEHFLINNSPILKISPSSGPIVIGGSNCLLYNFGNKLKK